MWYSHSLSLSPPGWCDGARRHTTRPWALPASGARLVRFGKDHVDHEFLVVGTHEIDVGGTPCRGDDGGGPAGGRDLLATHPDPFDLGAHGQLCLRLGLANQTQDLGSRGQDSRVTVTAGIAVLRGVRPALGVDRTLLPPAPDLLCDKGQEGREQPVQGPQSDEQGRTRRSTLFRFGVVGTGLDQLQVVVAKTPEETLDALQSTGV